DDVARPADVVLHPAIMTRIGLLGCWPSFMTAQAARARPTNVKEWSTPTVPAVHPCVKHAVGADVSVSVREVRRTAGAEEVHIVIPVQRFRSSPALLRSNPRRGALALLLALLLGACGQSPSIVLVLD